MIAPHVAEDLRKAVKEAKTIAQLRRVLVRLIQLLEDEGDDV